MTEKNIYNLKKILQFKIQKISNCFADKSMTFFFIQAWCWLYGADTCWTDILLHGFFMARNKHILLRYLVVFFRPAEFDKEFN